MEHMLSMEEIKKYLDHNYECICGIIAHGAQNGITPRGEELLHYHLENREHMMEWLKAKEHKHAMTPDNPAADAGQKPYFGG